MNFEIDYPTDREIEEQRKIVMRRVFDKPMQRPSPRIVFYQCRTSAVISLLVYFCLIFLCSLIQPDNVSGGFLALAVFPLTYFSFYFLSILSEEQSEVMELKLSLRYSFGYLVSLRMLYASLAAIGLNIVMLLSLFGRFVNYRSIGAAGTTSMLLLALVTLASYEKTGSTKLSAIILSVWTTVCIILMQYGEPLYHLMIEIIPFAVHISTAAASLALFAIYIRKVEKQNAYGL